MDGLKPCPWCGELPIIQTRAKYGKGMEYRIIDSNTECGVFPATGWKKKKYEAEMIWNNRT